MENNNVNNNVVVSKPKSKVGMMIIIIILIIVAVVAYMYINKMKNTPVPSTESEIGLNKAVDMDSTASINSSLDNINVEDTSTVDMQEIDKELQNL